MANCSSQTANLLLIAICLLITADFINYLLTPTEVG
jgi:hypothetical protein